MSNTAGWGRPVNAAVGNTVHWWRPDNVRACHPTDYTGYAGDRINDEEVNVLEACPQCLLVVSEAREVLGRA